MAFKSLTHPENPESYNDQLSQGNFPGVIIAEVTRNDDPEEIGRVKVLCKLINPDDELPCGEDGWIQTTEAFTGNAINAGSHRMIPVGTIVMVLPVFPADGKNWIVAGCLPNRIDRPHPDTNRARGTHGNVTPNEVFDVSNDTDQSHIKAFPHGVVDHTSATGDRTIQTQEGARMQLTQKGDSRMENTKAFMHVAEDGTVKQRAKSGAIAQLKATGEVQIDSAFAKGLNMSQFATTLDGPLTGISAQMTDLASSLQGYIGQAKEILGTFNNIADELGIPVDTDALATVLEDADGFLDQIQNGIGKSLETAQKALTALENEDALALGRTLTQQVRSMAKYGEVIGQIEELTQAEGMPFTEMMQQVLEVIPEDWTQGIDMNQISAVVEALGYDRKRQMEFILDRFLPGGYESVQNMLSTGFHRTAPAIESALSEPLPTDPTEQALEIERRTAKALEAVPEKQKSEVLRSKFKDLAANPDTPQLSEKVLGTLQKGLIEKTAEKAFGPVLPDGTRDSSADSIQNFVGQIGQVRAAFQAIQSGDMNQILESVTPLLEQSGFGNLAPIFEQMQGGDLNFQDLTRGISGALGDKMPQLAEAMEWANQLSEAIPANLSGATLSLTPMIGELTDPTKTSSIFATVATAGIKSAYGQLVLGASGLSMSSISGAINMISKVGGLLMSKKGLSITSLKGVGEDGDGFPTWSGKGPQILVEGDRIRLQAQGDSNDNGANELRIEQDGIYFGDHNLEDLFNRLSALEAANQGGGAA